MEASTLVDTENGEKRTTLNNVVEKAKAVYERLQDQTATAAKVTDKTIREHPYQAAGIAFGVGMLIGVLAMWCRRD